MRLRRLKRDGSGWCDANLLQCPGAKTYPRVCRDSFLSDGEAVQLPEMGTKVSMLLGRAWSIQAKINDLNGILEVVKEQLSEALANELAGLR